MIPSSRVDPNRPSAAAVTGEPFALAMASIGAADLVADTVLGHPSLASANLGWLLVFLGLFVACGCWWALYLWLLHRLAGWPWRFGILQSRVPVAVLSLSLLPDAALTLSGRLPYSLTFDPATQSLWLWIAGIILGLVIVMQELILLGAVREESIAGLLSDGWSRAVGLCAGAKGIPAWTARQLWTHPLLVLLMVAGVVLRWIDRMAWHGGDMDVQLAITYNILIWPPTDYYHLYRPQTWVYNHLPLFPLMTAPIYWLFENVVNLPKEWSAKLLTAVADLVVGVLIYRQAGIRWHRAWGLVLAAAWLLAPWVVGADDHPIGPAIAFTLAAFAFPDRAWLCGLLLALGVATRSETVFFLLPLALHFATKRGVGQAVAFLALFGTTLLAIAAPFFLYDPEAMDYAVRGQIQRDASNQMSMLMATLLPILSQGATSFLQRNPSLLSFGLNLLVAMAALRDRRVLRVLVAAGIAYLITLPVMSERYFLFAFAVGLFYAAQYGDLLVGAATLAMTWVGLPYGGLVRIALFVAMLLQSLLWPERRRSDRPDEGHLKPADLVSGHPGG